MARVTGVGGVFLRSGDPKRLSAWYVEHLGFAKGPMGFAFPWTDEEPAGTGMTLWSAFPGDTKYFGPDHEVGEGTFTRQMAMVNYRVDDLDALLERLTASGVWIDPERPVYDFGRFAWIKDCDGNRIELWQPLADATDSNPPAA